MPGAVQPDGLLLLGVELKAKQELLCAARSGFARAECIEADVPLPSLRVVG